MRTATRWMLCLVAAAGARVVLAQSPMSNGAGDGEANVPFATVVPAEELGGGSGEPGRAEPAKDAAQLARDESAAREAEAAFLTHVWTDP